LAFDETRETVPSNPRSPGWIGNGFGSLFIGVVLALQAGIGMLAPRSAVPLTDPYTYLVDVLQRVGEHPSARAVELTPRVWKTRFADDPLRSDLDRARDPPTR